MKTQVPAPKFTSFKPKAAPPTAKHVAEPSDSGRTYRHDHNNHKHHEPYPEPAHHEYERRYASKQRGLPVRNLVAEELEHGQGLFIVDKRGDNQIPRYGSLHRYSIPPYRRSGCGSVLGLPSDKKIDRDVSTERELVMAGGENASDTKRNRPILSKRLPVHGKLLRVVAQENPDRGVDQEYISVLSRKRKRRSESPLSDKVDYRSIEGKAKRYSQLPEDPDLMYESDPTEALEDVSAEVLKRNSELSLRTQLEPRNVNAWLELIGHQQAVIGGSQSLASSTKRALADIRLSMYEQALKQVRKHQQDRARLLLGYLELGSTIWDSRKLAARWSEVLREQPSSIEIWTSYIDFIQTNFTTFRYESCRSMFHDCLRVLQAAAEQRKDDRSALDELFSINVYVLLRMTVYMREAGYQEHATATWQAVLEYYLYRPKELGNDVQNSPSDLGHSAHLGAFEQFWESEVARIGEPQALGWAHYHANGGSAPNPTVIRLETSVSPDDCFRNFGIAEEERATALHFPGRTTDEEDDPYHIILFSDVRDVLNLLPLGIPQLTLVQAYLCFCGLPPLSLSDETLSSTYWLDSFLRREALEDELMSRFRHVLSDLRSGPEPATFATTLAALSSSPMRYSQTTSEKLFGDAFPTELGSDQQREYIRQTLKAIAAVIPKSETITEYYIAFEWRYFSASALRTAKSLFKAAPSSLRLYNAYALLEARAGRWSAANRVFSTALGMGSNLPQDQRKDTILLWRTWIWECLRSGAIGAAACRVLDIGNDKPSPDCVAIDLPEFGSAAVLRTKRALTEGRDYMLSANDHHAVLFTECLALLVYLQRRNDIGAALDVFHQTSALLKSRGLLSSPLNELNHEAQAKLLAFHVSHTKSYKPSLLRTELADSIMLFSSNTSLLATYAANEARSRLDDRVRTIMRDLVLKEKQDTIVGWFFAIWSEFNRGTGLGATVHSIRAVFERAVVSKR